MFNPAQQQALSHVPQEGPLLLLAGAGTGKTHTLVHRIVALQTQFLVPASKILCLTFTKAAAAEMQSRIQKQNANIGFIGTFHSFAYTLLKTYNPQILHNKEESLVESLLPELLYLLESPKTLNLIQEQYPHILVDEFQDIDPIQYKIIRKLYNKGSLFVVGDDYQAIYAFRGAAPDIIRSFPSDYPQTKLIKMEENFRSRPNILKWANRVFIGDDKQFSKTLRPHTPSPKGKSKAHHFLTTQAENAFLEKSILKQPTQTTIAILCRHNRLVEYYQDWAKAKIPQQCIAILTLHSSKGLEFDVVYFAGCAQELSPTVPRKDKKQYQEEKRLFYVGLTRAKRELHLLFCESRLWRGKVKHFKKSPFLRVCSPFASVSLRIKSL